VILQNHTRNIIGKNSLYSNLTLPFLDYNSTMIKHIITCKIVKKCKHLMNYGCPAKIVSYTFVVLVNCKAC